MTPIVRKDRAVRVALGVTVVLLMVLPALVTIGKLAGRTWFPVDDFGVTDLRVRDLWTLDTPLTGLYSRNGWNHPGPLMFWLMGLVSWPFGGAAWAVRISGAVIQGGAIAWLAWVTWRHGLRIFLAAATVTALSYAAFGSTLFTQPWNPNIPVSCFILFLYLTALTADGWIRQLIAMSVVGNVIVQTHISYGSLVIVGFAWAVAWILWDAHRAHRAPPHWKSTIVISAVVWGVVWTLPIVDVIVNWPGNLGKIANYFFGSHPSVGLQSATGIMADEFRWVPNWLGAVTRTVPLSGRAVPGSRLWLLVPVALLVLGFFAARRAASRTDARMVGLAAVMLVTGILAISNADEPRAYTFAWRAVIAAFVIVTCVWACASVVPRVPRATKVVAVAFVVGVVAWGTVGLGVSVSSSPDYTGLELQGPALGDVMRQLRREGLPKHQVILLQPGGTELPSLWRGLVDELDRAGVDVRVNPQVGRVFGEQRTAGPAAADEVWTVVSQGSYIPDLVGAPGARLIASTTPLSAAEEAETARLQQQLLDELRRAKRADMRGWLDSPLVPFVLERVPGIDRLAASRLSVLNRRVQQRSGCRCAVVASPASP